MSTEYLEFHRHDLEAIAELWQAFWNAESTTAQLAIHSEIRLAQRDYGLTPMDLRRLQWQIKHPDGEKPKAEKKPKAKKKPADPRKILRIAK